MSQQREVTRDEVLWLLGSLSALFRIPFDAALIAQAYPPPCTLATLHDGARSIGLRTGTVRVPRADWSKLPLPAIAFLRRDAPMPPDDPQAPGDGAEVSAGAAGRKGATSPPGGALLIVRADAERLLCCLPGREVPETLRIADARHRLEPELVLVAAASAGAGDGDVAGFPAATRAFGFRWFVPELLRHRRVWRDVLVASLAIQLVGLAVPIFTQVIIDKVIVHQAQSTLVVLGVALVMFMLFTSAMTWLRQYLVLHTGNRIDAVLGTQGLPPSAAPAAALFRAAPHRHAGRAHCTAWRPSASSSPARP